MYVYLYDTIVKEKKWREEVQRIETTLTDFGIAGKIIRLQHFASVDTLLDEEISRGATTVVVVGNDATFGHVLSRCAGKSVLFGFLPIGPQNTIAEVLGIPTGVAACDVLSRRRKVALDVGTYNNRFFVSRLHIPPSHITVTYDEKFQVSPKYGKMELVVCNLQPFFWQEKGKPAYVVHPQDGKLEAFLRPMVARTLWGREVYEEPSIFPFEEMVVKGKKAFVVEADGKASKEVEITITLGKQKIQMIVGAERKF